MLLTYLQELWDGVNKEKGKIFVGFQTMRDWSPFLKFKYVQHWEFKGKTISLPIYEPIDMDMHEEYLMGDIHHIFNVLKLHSNPFLIDRDNSYQDKYWKLYGHSNDIDSALTDILDFINDMNESILISVNGESGWGKTLFARCLIEKLNSSQRFKFDWLNKEKIVILASSINSLSEKLFLNSWIPILRSMLEILKTRRNMKKEIILEKLYEDNEDILDSKYLQFDFN